VRDIEIVRVKETFPDFYDVSKVKQPRRGIAASAEYQREYSKMMERFYSFYRYNHFNVLARFINALVSGVAGTKKDRMNNVDRSACMNHSFERGIKFAISCVSSYYKKLIGGKYGRPSDAYLEGLPVCAIYNTNDVEDLHDRGLAIAYGGEMPHMTVLRLFKRSKYMETHVIDKRNKPIPRYLIMPGIDHEGNEITIPEYGLQHLKENYHGATVLMIDALPEHGFFSMNVPQVAIGGLPTSGEEKTPYYVYAIASAVLRYENKI